MARGIYESLPALHFMAICAVSAVSPKQVKLLAGLMSPEGVSALLWRAARMPGPGMPLETAAICWSPAMPAAGRSLVALSSEPAPSTRPVPAAEKDCWVLV